MTEQKYNQRKATVLKFSPDIFPQIGLAQRLKDVSFVVLNWF